MSVSLIVAVLGLTALMLAGIVGGFVAGLYAARFVLLPERQIAGMAATVARSAREVAAIHAVAVLELRGLAAASTAPVLPPSVLVIDSTEV
jgi:hypothetical protein